MSIRHKDIIIDKINPFANCKLDRRKYAEVLTQIIRAYDDGFVLAINNEWGTGKTTFVKMWQQHMENQNLKTLYFNAWENDFDINPMAAILGELKKLLPDGNQISYNSLLKKGAVLAQNILPGVLKALTKKYFDIDEVVGAVEGATKGATEILKSEIENYAKKQKGFKEFREELEKFVNETIETRPLVFIIDELDRCRPDFAVEVLEKMKHFFSVPGIVFVLCIDKRQLENAIKGFYGSEQLDATEYLRRFIDLEYTIPGPDSAGLCKYLYEYYGFEDFFNQPERVHHPDFHNDQDSFLVFTSMLFENKGLTFRRQEKIFAHARLALKSFQTTHFVFPSVYIFLIYLHSYHKEFFLNIKARMLSPQEFITEIEKLFPNQIAEQNFRFFVYTEALLLQFYNNFYRELHQDSKLVEQPSDNGEKKLLIKSRIELDNETPLLLEFLNSFRKERFYNFKLDFLIKKIELIERMTN